MLQRQITHWARRAPNKLARWTAVAGSLGLGLALVGGALLALPAAGALAAPAGTNYPYPGSGNCSTTLQACINGASAGDTIKISAGTYTESLTLNKAVSLIGAGPYATILKAPANQRVLTISGNITPSTVISGLMVTGGQAGSGLDFGGGLRVSTPAQPLLAGLVISNNHATTGGGLATDLPLQVIHSLFYGNVASAAGGGLRGPADLVDTQFISNTGSGGGLWTMDPVTITRGRFERNAGLAQGGAVATFSNLVMTDTAVVSNTSTGDAGGVESIGLGTTVIAGGYFTGNQGLNGGALDAYRLAFNSTVFANNTSTGPGGAINSGLWVAGQNGRFEGNHAVGASGKGGAIYAGGAMTLTQLVMLSNTAEAEGGGVFSLAGGRLTGGHLENNSAPGGYGGGMSLDSYPSFPLTGLDLSGTSFISNSAYYGGGLYVFQPAVITGGTFTRNAAGSSGGGIEIDDPLTLSGTTFISNTAGNGGGLYVYQGAAVITNSVFVHNSAGGSGGGLDVDTFGLIASGTVFSGNSAASGQGGGAYVQTGVTLTGGHFEANHSGSDGGGLYTSSSHANSLLAQTDFISNSAAEDGGGFYSSGQAVLLGGRYERNTAVRYGGGWYLYNGASLTDTNMVSNTATWGGGGYADSGATLHRAQFAGNTATTGGGGGLYSAGQTEVAASGLTGNSALQGGGLYFWGSGDVVNSLLADNQASQAAAALYIYFHGQVAVVQTTIAAATPNPRQAIVVSYGQLLVTNTILSNYAVGISVTPNSVLGNVAVESFNLFYGATANTQGNVTHGGNDLTGQNPLFANPAGGDYHLSGASPAIDHGTNAGVFVDYDGDPRPLGAGFDIGFDERLAVALNHKLYLPLVLR